MKKVICIGSALQDIFLPTGDGTVLETPEDVTARRKIAFELGAKYRIEDRHTATGGCALNVGVGLARLGIASSVYSLIGGDSVGAWIRDTLVRNNVGTGLLRQVTEAKSDLSIVLVDRHTGDRVVFVNRDLQEQLVLDEGMLSDGEVLFVGSLAGSRWATNLTTIHRVAAARDFPFAYNPGQDNIAENATAVLDAVRHASYLFVNTDEATALVLASGGDKRLVDTPHYLLSWLRDIGAATIVMTGGPEGAWMYCGDRVLSVAAQGGERPVDTTGAGDAFTSATLAGLLYGEDPRMALAWGAVNAGAVVRHYGATEGLQSLQVMRRHVTAVAHHVRMERLGD